MAALAAAGLVGRSEAKPTLPQESIPTDAAPKVRRYIEQLYSLDATTRGLAAFALGRLGDGAEPAVPFLISMLGDDAGLEWEVKEGDPTDPKEEAKRRILGFYKDKETSPGREAARALGRICTAASEVLLAVLKDPTPAARRHAAEALAAIRDKKATKPVMLLLQDADKGVREQAARALGRLRDTTATEALMAALKDQERSVRREAALALGELKDPRALPSLLDALLDAPEVRAAAELVLLETRDLRAVEPLILSLKHRKEDVRRTSARLLAAIGDRRAVRPLIQALRDTAGDVRYEAATALRRMSGEDFGSDPDKWQRWNELDAAAKEIEEKLTDEPIHAYIGALHSPNWAARAYAARALGNLDDRRAVTPLRSALWDRDATVRRNAAATLGQLGDPRAVEPLLAAVSDADPEVQEAAEEALRRICGANLGRDTRKWQEWWDENRDSVFARDSGKEDEEDTLEAERRRAEEEAPVKLRAGTRTLILLAALALVAVSPIVLLAVLRARRRR